MRETLLRPERGADHLAACAVGTDNASDVPPGGGRPDDRVVVFLDGELDAASAPGLAEQLAPLAETGSHLILDLAGLRFCDCAGLNLFLRLRQRASAAGGSLHLAAPGPAVRRLIVLTHLQTILPIAVGSADVITAHGGDAVTTPPLPASR